MNNEFSSSNLGPIQRAEMRARIYAAAFVAQFIEVGNRLGYEAAIDDTPRIHDESESIADVWCECSALHVTPCEPVDRAFDELMEKPNDET